MTNTNDLPRLILTFGRCDGVTAEADHLSLVLGGDEGEVLECQECGWERMRTVEERARDISAFVACKALDPRTGAKLRAATPAESMAFVGQPVARAFRKPVRVGAVLVDSDTGPGIAHAGAGF